MWKAGRSEYVIAEFFSFAPAGISSIHQHLVSHRKDPNLHLRVGGRRERCWGEGGRDGMERERKRGRGAQQLAPFSLSLSPVAVSVSPIWWKSNSTLALIMWQLEFTYLVNPASWFRFQLISLWLLHLPRGWWRRAGGGEPAVCMRIQYDGDGGGRGSRT